MTTVHPALSFELFPPRSHASCESLIRTIAELEGTNPDYVSVTYSGDAKRRQKTLALLDYLVHETSLTPLAHLICAGHSVHELERAVRLLLCLLGSQCRGGAGAGNGLLRLLPGGQHGVKRGDGIFRQR